MLPESNSNKAKLLIVKIIRKRFILVLTGGKETKNFFNREFTRLQSFQELIQYFHGFGQFIMMQVMGRSINMY